jgi:peptidoglycan hydrolase-like protein with peptidoglycan-binding domain
MKPPQPWRRWVPAGAAIVILVIVLVAAMTAGDDDSSTDASDLPTSAAAIDSSTSTTAPAVIVEPTPTVPHTQLGQTVGYGNAGDEVKMVQQRLTDLGFAPGPIDGQFGSGTQQSVWAFEKLVLQTPRADVTGKVTNEMWRTMQDNLKILPLRPTGAGTTHVEIYVPQQVLIVFTDDTPKLITHISTGLQLPDGRPDNFCENADFNTDARGNPLPETVTKYVCADTKTPGGVFKIDHMLAGHHIGPLGGMDNPVYFNYGIAMHGAADVPKEPASHGCVRMNKTISLTFPQLVQVRDTVRVGPGRQATRGLHRRRVAAFVQPGRDRPERDHHDELDHDHDHRRDDDNEPGDDHHRRQADDERRHTDDGRHPAGEPQRNDDDRRRLTLRTRTRGSARPFAPADEGPRCFVPAEADLLAEVLHPAAHGVAVHARRDQ